MTTKSIKLPILIYDGNCGFCTRSVRLTERLPRRIELTPWQEVDLTALGTTTKRAQREVLWITQSGSVHGGAQAIGELLRHVGGRWRLIGTVIVLPGIRLVSSWVYRLIAANRYRLRGTTPACQLRPEDRPGSSSHLRGH